MGKITFKMVIRVPIQVPSPVTPRSRPVIPNLSPFPPPSIPPSLSASPPPPPLDGLHHSITDHKGQKSVNAVFEFQFYFRGEETVEFDLTAPLFGR